MPMIRGRKLWEEFRSFAFKGNVVDLAVGVIIGAAFGKIVDALVKQILMPIMAILLPGEQSYLQWSLMLKGQEIRYGLFLGELVNFLIVALALWLFFSKFLGALRDRRQREQAAAPPPKPSEDVLLLREIRDLLKQRTD